MTIKKVPPNPQSKRDVDWFGLKDPSLNGELGLDFQMSRQVTGLQKLAQKWLLIFLTPRGSDYFDPDMGTDLHGLLEANLNDTSYIHNMIRSSVMEANSQLRKYQSEAQSLPKDEIFENSAIKKLEYDTQGLKIELEVAIYNSLGQSRVIEVPTPYNGTLA